MKQGQLVHNKWLPGAVALAFLAAAALLSNSLQGEISLEVAGLAMNFQPHENGGLRLHFVRAS